MIYNKNKEEFVEIPQQIVEWIDRKKCVLEITPIENARKTKVDR